MLKRLIIHTVILSLFIFAAGFSQTVSAQQVFTKTVVPEGSRVLVKSSKTSQPRPKTALVLSGGGSRGMVHLGVIRELEKRNIPIDMIVGTSIGSVIGGLYASGYTTEQIVEITRSIKWEDIYKDETQRTSLFFGQKSEQDRYLLPIRFKDAKPFIPVAYSPGQKILTILSDLVLKAQYQARNNFDNLKIPFRSVATDLVSGKVVVLRRGNLAECMQASLAIPLLFTPVDMDSMLLVDGGLLSNLPVDVARAEGADIVLAVDVTSRLRTKDKITAPWEIVDQATTIMSDLSRKIQQQHADVLIKPDLKNLLNDDFSQADTLLDIGARALLEKLPAIEKIFSKPDSTQTVCCTVEEVMFEDGELPADEILKKLNVQTNASVLIPDDLTGDLNTIISSGNYHRVQAVADTLSEGLKITFSLEHFREIKNITIDGNTQFSDSELRAVMKSNPGQNFNSDTLQNDLDRITGLYRREGFSLMRINNIDWVEGILSLKIDEGYIDNVFVQGNRKTKDYVILRDFSSVKGRVFNWKTIHRAVQNVYTTQLYERVNVNIIERDYENDLLIKVKEKSSLLMRIGGKYDNDRRAQAYLELGDENFLGMGVKAMIVSRMGMRDGHFGIKIRDERVFTSYFTFNLQAYHNWEINPFNGTDNRYREERTGIRIQVGQQLRRIGQLVAELRQENIKDKTYSGTFTAQQDIELRTFALRALTDKRDRSDFPTKGIYNHWAWESGNRLVLESSESYFKALVNLEGFYTFNSLHTYHVKLFVGVADRTLPFSENFRLGGLHNFYGLHDNEYYGKQMFSSSAEYRFKVPFHLNKQNFVLRDSYLSLRYDFGGIWNDPALVFSTDDFFSAIGGALAFDTLFGPMYFAYGRTTRGTSVAYFSLGFNY